MRVLVTGAAGQVGWELLRSLQPQCEVIALDRRQLDLADAGQIRQVIAEHRPDAVVNAAAYTAVDLAEKETDQAAAINTRAPQALAQACLSLGALLIHYSTDFVYDGSGSAPVTEDTATAPLNVYGLTKLEGERAIEQAGGDWLVLRTSWVYSSRGRNFVRTMLRLAAERDRLSVVNDQVGAPTSARYLADATALILFQSMWQRRQQRFESGCYHLTAGGETSWHGFAQAIMAGARERGLPVRAAEVAGIPASQYPTAARRPLNSRLDSGRLTARFGIVPPPWQAGLALVMDEIAGQLQG